MKNMTLRGIDPDLSEKIKAIARMKGKSINAVVIEILRKQVGLEKEKKFTNTYDDLDHLFGRWSQDEFDTIQSKIDSERSIDKELWQ